MTVVFLIYGFAFLVLGVAIAVYPRSGSSFWLAGKIWLIGAFGIFHGINEWMDMIILINKPDEIILLSIMRTLILPVSFIFLLYFGLYGVIRLRAAFSILKPVPIAALSLWAVIAAINSTDLILADIWARYLIGVPGILLTAFALFTQGKEIEHAGLLHAKKYFRVSFIGFAAYGFVAGMVVPDADFIPASAVNYSVFSGTFGVPVQVVRSFCAVLIAFGMINILRVFDMETKESLRRARDELETSVEERTRELYEANVELEQEIAERSQAEAFASNILETVEEGFIIINNKYEIESANRAYGLQVKREVEDIVAQNCYRVSHALDRPCFEAGEDCAVKKTFETGKPHNAVHLHVDNEGNSRYVKLKSYPVMSHSGKVLKVIETIRDITERLKLEDQLRHAQKMEAIGQLAGGVAHDFNNILTAIIGYGNMLQTKVDNNDPLRVHVDKIMVSAERAATLTKSLLTYSRKQVVQLEPVAINDIIKRVENLLVHSMGENIALKTVVSNEYLQVLVDSNQIEQLLLNLATNARDAMPGGGRFTIETKRVDLDSSFVRAHGYGRTGTYVLITVTDDGDGMDPEVMERIFEPFFTTKEVGKGTGLGLSMVYGIVKQHKGYINVYSEPGEGTSFKIYLPLSDAETQSTGPDQAETPMSGSETILIAEDSKEIRTMLKTVLGDHGYSVIDAVNGEEAVSTLKERRDEIDLVIMDLMMPHMNGKEAYDVIRKENPGIKVLFISGYPEDYIQGKGLIDEEAHVIFKPLFPSRLLRELRKMLDARS